MSEITVRHEVEAILKLTRLHTEQQSNNILEAVASDPVTDAALAIADFHGEVLAELDKIIERYVQDDEPAETEPVKEKRLTLRVGDKVRLTGDQWDRDVHDYGIGDVVTIKRLDTVNPYEGRFEGGWFVWTADTEGNEGAYDEWGGDILSDYTEEIRVGDTVRILPTYDVVADGKGQVGKEFEVTRIVSADFDASTFYVEGDPRGWGVWAQHIEKVFK